jgi:hypothetical protein
MVIVFDDGSAGSEADLPPPSQGSAARGLVNLDELRNIHQQHGQAEAQPQAWWTQAERHLDLVHSVKDFWRVFSDDGEAQGAMLAYNYMYPHVDQHPHPTTAALRGGSSTVQRDEEREDRMITCHATTAATDGEVQMLNRAKEDSGDARTQQLHEVLRDVRRFIQTRMHPVQATYLGTTGDLFDSAGSGFNLQATLGPARTRGALCVFHRFHPAEVEGASGQPISFTVLLGPPPLMASPSSSSSASPQRRRSRSPPRMGSRGPLGRAAAAASTPARRQRTMSASASSPASHERRQ